jgi:predicted ATP-dependent endonuclease of OLD family
MRIKKVRVQNFRPILDATLECDKLTALVGANGAGKSTFLRAIELFYSINPKLVVEDFYNEDTSEAIEITITYTDLDAEEKERFKNYVEGDGLSVVRVLTLTENKYHGSALQNADFRTVRDAEAAAEIKAAYNALRNGTYAELPAYTNKDAAKAAIREWEQAHKERCVRERDEGQFFGFKQVGQGYLGKDTRFVFIPAVRDASEDAEEGRGSAITTLMDLLVRKRLFEKEEIRQFKADLQQQYREIVDPAHIPELTQLGADLTQTLQTYVGDASVTVSWDVPAEIDIPLPTANIRLVEDGFPTLVSKSGHGLQRAFILSILQHLSAQQMENLPAEEEPGAAEAAGQQQQPDLILGIEEPELYQHPTRQRHFADVLLQLTGGKIPGVARRVQIVYATHSPLLVGLDRFDQVRTIRKVSVEHEKPRVTQVAHRTLDEVAARIARANGDNKEFTGETLKARLVTLMGPSMSEGFFADVIVLVEGEEDRAVLEAAARSMQHDFNSLGIAVIGCGGKSNVFNAAAIFMSFGIPLYVMWDGDFHKGKTGGRCDKCSHKLDSKAEPKENQRIMRLLALGEEEWPEHVKPASACFKENLERKIEEEIGETLFDQLVDDVKAKYSIARRKDAVKNPTVLAKIFEEAKRQQHTSLTLENIVNAIISLRVPGEGTVKAVAAVRA